MWISTLDLEPRKIIPTHLLGHIWHGAYFSSFAPLQVQNLPRQALPASTWVRVRNRLAGICGSDLGLVYLNGDLRTAPAALPNHGRIYPGHEVVGEVIEVGNDVQEIGVGDSVVLQYGPNCVGADVRPLCRSCAHGNFNLCERGYQPGPAQFGGGWSEEMLLPAQQLFRIGPSSQNPAEPQLSDEQAVMLEPTAVALHAVLRCPPRTGDHVLIIGAGTIGLLTLQVVRALAPQAEISVLARHAFQVEQATRMGANHIIYPQDSYREIERVTGAQFYQGLLGNKVLLGGYDLIYDSVGTRQTIHDGLRWTRTHGTIVVIGVSLHMMNVDLSPIWQREIDLIGSLSHGLERWPSNAQSERSTFELAAEMLEQGHLGSEQLITHRFALNDYQHGLETAAHKAPTRAIKVIFDYALQPASVVPNVRASRPRHLASFPDSSTTIFSEEPEEEQDLQAEALEDTQPVEASPASDLRTAQANAETDVALEALQSPAEPTSNSEEESRPGAPPTPGQRSRKGKQASNYAQNRYRATESHPPVTNGTPGALQHVERPDGSRKRDS